VISAFAYAQTNPGFQEGYPLCANTDSTQCMSINPGLNQTFATKMDYNPPNIILTGAEPTVGAGQIGFGANTVDPSMCGSLPNVVGCIVVNINGAPHYIPYY
jgi:hypothetical protein